MWNEYLVTGINMGLNFATEYPYHGFNSTLTLMQPLYAGGRITTGNKLAKVGIKAAELKLQYYRIGYNQYSDFKLGKGFPETEKTVFNQMSSFNAGLIPIPDVLMNQTKLMEASENLIDKQIEYSKAMTAYNGRK